jgi:hypothetical protein
MFDTTAIKTITFTLNKKLHAPIMQKKYAYFFLEINWYFLLLINRKISRLADQIYLQKPFINQRQTLFNQRDFRSLTNNTGGNCSLNNDILLLLLLGVILFSYNDNFLIN